MANHSLPTLTSTYTNFLTELGARLDDAVRQGRSDTVTLTNPPVGTIRFNTTSLLWEQNTGTVGSPVWTTLATTYGIDVQSVDGKSFGTFTAAGGIVYATSTTAASATAAGTSGQPLLSGGAGVPTWGTVAATFGGTGQTSYVIGDLLYASSTTALSKLADVATGNSLISGGVGVAPSWGKIGLTTHVSGTLPIANGGTNSTATPTNGGVTYGTGSAQAYTAAGTSGQALVSNGATAPTWTTLTLENLPGAAFKRSVACATTAALTLNTAQTTIDGVTISANSRVLVKNQATASQNGIYTNLTTTTWTRTADADAASEIGGATVNVDAGTTNGGTMFTTSFKTTDTLGTTAMNWFRVVDTGYTIPATQGGTGQTTFAVGDLLYASSASALSKLTAGTAGTLLQANGAAAPSWVAASTINAGQVDGKDFGTFTAAGGILYATSTTAASGTAAGTSGQALLSGGASAPTWGTLGVAAGGSGATTAAAARVNLAVETSATGSTRLAVGTTAQRDASPSAGFIRFNTSLTRFEGWNGSAWSAVGGGATGGGTDDIFIENGQTVTTNYTITTNKNAMSAGPITIASGITVTVPSGSTWVVV
jgi:hypothetical protein